MASGCGGKSSKSKPYKYFQSKFTLKPFTALNFRRARPEGGARASR